jgi:hypothetical protein
MRGMPETERTRAELAELAELDAAADRPPQQPRVELRWAGAASAFGSATPALLAALQQAGTPFEPASAAPDEHLDALAQTLRRLALSGRWRDETVRVAHPAGWTRIERGCARVLGLPTLAVHRVQRISEIGAAPGSARRRGVGAARCPGWTPGPATQRPPGCLAGPALRVSACAGRPRRCRRSPWDLPRLPAAA